MIAHDILQRFVKWSDHQVLVDQVSRITEGTLPLAFWTGYKETVLVSALYLGSWSVITEQDEDKCVRVLPRRWLDINGRVMTEVWRSACRAAMGTLVFHPGISHVRDLIPVEDTVADK